MTNESNESLIDQIDALRAEIARLREENARLREENAGLLPPKFDYTVLLEAARHAAAQREAENPRPPQRAPGGGG